MTALMVVGGVTLMMVGLALLIEAAFDAACKWMGEDDDGS